MTKKRKLRSACCSAPVYVAGFVTRDYQCTVCGQPCTVRIPVDPNGDRG